MSKPKPLPVVMSPPVPVPLDAVLPPEKPPLPWYRRCPLCWSGRGGVGLAYSTQGITRFYKCVRASGGEPGCGHTWTATLDRQTIVPVMVEHQVVTIASQRIGSNAIGNEPAAESAQ